MGRAELGIVDSRLFEAQLAVDSEAHFGGVIVFLAVVFPPADRAKLECRGRFESLLSAARATVARFDRRTHKGMDAKNGARDYGGSCAVSVACAPQGHSSSAGELPGFGVDLDLLALLNEERNLDFQASLKPGKFGDVA